MPGTLTLKTVLASAKVEAPEVRATNFKLPDGTSLTGDLETAVYGPRVTAVATALEAVIPVRLIARTETDTPEMILHAAYSQHNFMPFSQGTTTENKLSAIEQFLSHVAAREILYEQAVSASTTFLVTFQQVGGQNKYLVDEEVQATLNLNQGNTYVFDWSAASEHPLRFSSTADGTHGGVGVEYTTGVIVDTANYTTTITIAESTPPLFYYCQHHDSMGGQANTPPAVTEVRRGTPPIGTFDASLSIFQRILQVENAVEILTSLRTMRVGSNGAVSLGAMTSDFVVGGGSISDTFDAADDTNAPTMKAVFDFLTDAGLTFSEAGDTGGTEADESTGTTSDIRLKSNLTPIHEAMETIRKLSPQTYDKFESIPTTGKSHPDAGFIAQQVESVPELARFVITPPEDAAPKRLNYSALFTHAVAAIQELDRFVQDQAARISALENQ